MFGALVSYGKPSAKVVVDGKQRRVQAKLRDASCDTPTAAGISGWGKGKVYRGGHEHVGHELAYP
jgi:hypothetical protein